MQQGYIKVAAATPDVRVCDVAYNTVKILESMKQIAADGAKVIVFPELAITGATCGDLFFHKVLVDAAKKALFHIAKETESMDAIVFVGLPMDVQGKLYNVAAALWNGEVLGFVPKTVLANYADNYECRWFTPGRADIEEVVLDAEAGIVVPFGTNQVFCCNEMSGLRIAVEIGEDLWAVEPPSTKHALAGATVIVNLAAHEEIVGKDVYRRSLINNQSARIISGYIMAGAGCGESTGDAVYAGPCLIAENGKQLAENQLFSGDTAMSEIDVDLIEIERRKRNTYQSMTNPDYLYVDFSLAVSETVLTRELEAFPFVPADADKKDAHCKQILELQAHGLKKRLAHARCENAVIGISGGLDSTLALLVTAKAFDLLGLSRDKITAVTMPGFGTTDRTYDNAVQMIRLIGATFKEVSIVEAVNVHFKDINQDSSVHDVTYENAQARERTQILMDLANQTNGMVVGTGDLSEMALGWATYNGDHMSMYGVNGSVPKTLVRHVVRYYAENCEEEQLKAVLFDVLDTPVSPELLPPEDGQIAQKTEDIVGPYELHDFFIYYLVRYGFTPEKILRMAKRAFDGIYEEAVIEKWLSTCLRRFFTQQFKRSCVPDGPKVGSVALSPRGDLRMPSDACNGLWTI